MNEVKIVLKDCSYITTSKWSVVDAYIKHRNVKALYLNNVVTFNVNYIRDVLENN